MDYEKIGKFIQELRKEKNLTQNDLAVKLNITDKAVSKWERGKGCPDVSILEDLSKVLDISILELLKGEKIESKDSIDINESIIDTINYSKEEINNKFKSILLNILTTIIILVVSVVILLNICHIYSLNRKVTYDFSSGYTDTIKSNLDTIKINIDTLKLSETNFTEQENGELIKTLENAYSYLSKHPLLEYEGKNTLTQNDLYVLNEYSNIYNMNDFVSSYKILEKYDKSLSIYKTHSYTFNRMENFTYSYKVITTLNDPTNLKINNIIYNLWYITDELLILSNNSLKVGVVNE